MNNIQFIYKNAKNVYISLVNMTDFCYNDNCIKDDRGAEQKKNREPAGCELFGGILRRIGNPGAGF